MTSNHVFVFVQHSMNAKPVLAGRLVFSQYGIAFSYAKTWLKNEHAFAFHPVLLPLGGGVFSEAGLEGVLSVFRDAGPGIWGKEVIKRLHGQVGIDEQLILSNNLLRIGVFRYSRNQKDEFIATDTTEEMSLQDIFDAVQLFESGGQLNERQRLLLEQGSSMDGMQPKDFFRIHGKPCIVKFPFKNSKDNKAANEWIGMTLATACGIVAPNTSIVPLMPERFALAVERFDIDNGSIYPLMSAASAMGFREQDDYKKSYIELAKTIIAMSVNPKEDCISLFKRMALNVMISNKDDHIYNHAFIKKDNGWRLSPAYDVVCGEGMKRDHAMVIGVNGRAGTLVNVLSACAFFGLSLSDAQWIIDDMLGVVSDWKVRVKNNGLTEQEINGIAWAILHNDIFAGYEFSR
jgi:serine/threonine-protein kinase HipA